MNMTLKKQLENIIWHIEMNREVLGDTVTLNGVLSSLSNIVEDDKLSRRNIMKKM